MPSLPPSCLTWRIVAVEPPHLRRRCHRCRDSRPFAPLDRFRVNANGRRLDVWLVYRCAVCTSAYELEVVARAPVRELGSRLERFHANDPDLARQLAFDPAVSRRGGTLEPVVFRVDGPRPERPYVAVLRFPEPFSVRLDRVISLGLGIPRREVEAGLERGLLATEHRLSRPARDGMRVTVVPGR